MNIDTDNYIICKNQILSPKSPRGLINEYMKGLSKQCSILLDEKRKKIKMDDDDFTVPSFSQYQDLLKYNYKLQQLKTICKEYKLKLSGNKNELLNRIFIFLKLSTSLVQIQCRIRGYLHRKYIRLHGPAYKSREMCVNDCDFLSGEPLKDISYQQFISFKDKDEFVYGFDIISLYNLGIRSDTQPQNPYNRNVLPKSLFRNLKTIMRLSSVLDFPINVDIEEEEKANTKSLDDRIVDIFIKMDSLGNYTNINWFTSLDKSHMMTFMRELYDIWMYRAQLTTQTRRQICPTGNPFTSVHISYLQIEDNPDVIKKSIVEVMELFINSGYNEANQALGAMYVLSALTLVNKDAAEALPWLYESVYY